MLSLLTFLVAVLLIPAGFLFLWPLVARWLGRDDLLVALTALGLSVGALTQLSFLLAGFGVLSVWPLLGLIGLGWGAGYALNPAWFRLEWARAALRHGWEALARLDAGGLSLLVMLLSLAVVLVSALYYPFLADDTLTRYALHARLIYDSRALPAEVRGFPLLVPLSFTYTWLVGGALNEHLAKVATFALAAGLVAGTVLVGRRLAGRLNGLLAGAVLAVTPMFVNWAGTGYTDIPTGFYVTLGALFALRWCEQGTGRDALLAGILTGLALWTKPSAFLMLASLVGIAILRALYTRQVRAGLAGLAPLFLPGLLLAGPWYARNYLLEGPGGILVLPGLYHVLGLRPSLSGLLPPLQYPVDFGVPLVPLYALAIVLALWRGLRGGWAALRGYGEWPLADLVGLAVVVPYWLAWWTRFSFDPRFLLVVVAFYAGWAAWPLAWLLERLGWQARRAWLGLPLAGLLLVIATHLQLGATVFTLTQPFASDAAKLTHAKKDLYPTVMWFEAHLKPGERVLSMDARLRYYLIDYDIVSAYPFSFEQIAEFDYVVDFSGTTGVYQTLGWTDTDYWQHRRDPYYFEEVFDGGYGSEILRVLPTVGQEAD